MPWIVFLVADAGIWPRWGSKLITHFDSLSFLFICNKWALDFVASIQNFSGVDHSIKVSHRRKTFAMVEDMMLASDTVIDLFNLFSHLLNLRTLVKWSYHGYRKKGWVDNWVVTMQCLSLFSFFKYDRVYENRHWRPKYIENFVITHFGTFNRVNLNF